MGFSVTNECSLAVCKDGAASRCPKVTIHHCSSVDSLAGEAVC